MEMNKSRLSGQGLLRSPVPPLDSPPLPSVSAEGKTKVDKLLEQVESITPSDSISSKAEEPYQSWLRDACNDSNTLKYAVERFHQYWLSDRSAVLKAAIFLRANYMFEIDGQKLRPDLLMCLQKDFENRQDMQAKSPEKFLNAAAFLIEIYSRVRIEKLPLDFMSEPVFQYLEDLLNGDDSEIELFAHVVIGVSPTLQDAQGGRCNQSSLSSYHPLQNLFCKVRSTLMSRNLSSQSRLWLLFIVDVSSNGEFRPPALSLKKFYKEKDHLGCAVDSLIKSLGDTSVTQSSSEQVVDGSLSVVESTVRNKMSEINISPKASEKSNAEKGSFTGTKKRSPGKSENFDKRDNFRSALHVNQSKGTKGKNYWLHDDRFEREDTPSNEENSENLTRPRASQGNWKRSSAPKEERENKSRANDDSWRQNQSSDNNWRLPQSNKAPKEIPKPGTTDALLLAGHIISESWD